MRNARVVLPIISLLLLSCVVAAQDKAPTNTSLPYTKGRPWFPTFWSPYSPMKVPDPDLGNSARADQLMSQGKLVLSLSDAISLALENNLDIAIQRDNPKIADLDILRTQAGTAPRGVRTSVTSASATGGGGAGSQGGTGTAAGGVGQGASGLTTSTLGAGSSIGSFDPVLTSTLSVEHRLYPITSVVTQRVQQLSAAQLNTTTANFAYQQAFHSGTGLSVGWTNNRQTSPLNTLSPQVSSNFQVSLTQHLLQGFGFATNTRNIRLAKNNREVSDLVFKQQVMLTVTQVENAYWDLVSALSDVRVKESAVTVAEKLYNDNKRQVEIGTLAPIEIVRAEAQVAGTKQDLIVSQTVLQQQETNVKNLVLKNLSDPALMTARVVPTERITVPPVEPVVPIQELFGMALSSRPELTQSRIDLKNREISWKGVKNGMLPSLDAYAYWAGTASSGNINQRVVPDPSQVPAFLIGGLGSSWRQVFGGDFPDYAVGFQLSIPIRNRSAQADAAQAQIENGQAVLRLRQLENGVRVEVQNAVIALQQNRARLETAQKQRVLQEQTLDAEQKKFQLGASTIFLVIQAQRDLATAQGAEVKALNDYMKSRVELDRASGQIITKNGISLEEAYNGHVTKPPQALPVSRQD